MDFIFKLYYFAVRAGRSLVRVAFVEAARFPGGQGLALFLNEALDGGCVLSEGHPVLSHYGPAL